MNIPQFLHRPPSKTPQSGQKAIPVDGNLATVLEWSSGDGQPSAGTLILTGRLAQGIATATSCMVAKLTIGTGSGYTVQWYPVPNVIPIVGNTVRVEMRVMVSPMGFQMDQQGVVAPTENVGPGDVQSATGYAVLGDVWADQAPSTLIFQSTGLGQNNTAALVMGPVFVTAAVFSNTTASPVQIVILDTRRVFTGVPNIPNAAQALIVPATSTIALGADALGAFFRGFQVFAVNDITAFGGTGWGGYNQPGGAGTMLSVYGIYYPMGPS